MKIGTVMTMNDASLQAVVGALNETARLLSHWEFKEGRDRIEVEAMRNNVLKAVKYIYDQDNIIKALMGEYGDSCDVDTCKGESK